MLRNFVTIAVSLGLLAACSTPYRPPVMVRDSTPFPGIAGIIGENTRQPVDVLVVHGMCTHTPAWAPGIFDTITGAIKANYQAPAAASPTVARNAVQHVSRTEQAAGGTIRYHGLVWSPLTFPLKRQLDYDNTGTPSDCATETECKPTRAYFNGLLKDRLLNDCLSDAMIYEGRSHPQIRQAMVDAVADILENAGNGNGPLVVVAESLGSKLLFDALSEMLLPDAPPHLQQLGQHAARRLALIFMAGNQLPILGLAEQQIETPPSAPVMESDALQRFLALRRAQVKPPSAGELQRLAIVAFTDPNDLLAYRLLPSRYQAPDVSVTDVLVSNSPSYLGLIENPFAAHLNYLTNTDVGRLIACGRPTAPSCR